MSWTGWLLFILIVQVVHFAGTWKLYILAGRKAWEAAIPVYNSIILMKIINRPWWWTILLFVPIVNLIMIPVVWVETLRSFGRNTTTDTILVLLTLGLYIYYINYTQKVTYIEERSLKPRTSAGEWVSSILFAVVAATIVHTYFMQPFTIPTSSLEKTLLVGDFLFVSKFHYGARTPMTPISFPMVHDTIPVLKTKSYLAEPQLPYFRLPGFQQIERSDIVVFNWPVDTVNAFQQYGDGKYYYKPIDKKSNYVKRCVGLPGDSLEIKDGFVFINGTRLNLPERALPQYSYWVLFKPNARLSDRQLYELYGITDGVSQYDETTGEFKVHAMTDEVALRLKNNPNVVSMRKEISPKGEMETKPYYDRNRNIQFDRTILFPNNGIESWNRDNMGAIYIPEQGKTVAINSKSIGFYKRVIEVYEGSEMGIENKITQSGTQVLLNGSPLAEYTFKQDYYWMMGDNRHNSEDSRYWGYVPANHIVGKPVFVWMSWNTHASGLFNKFRWDRMFTTVGGEGKPVSYFKYFLILLAGWFIFDFFRKRKKKNT